MHNIRKKADLCFIFSHCSERIYLTIQIYLRKSPRLRMSILAFPWIV